MICIYYIFAVYYLTTKRYPLLFVYPDQGCSVLYYYISYTSILFKLLFEHP